MCVVGKTATAWCALHILFTASMISSNRGTQKHQVCSIMFLTTCSSGYLTGGKASLLPGMELPQFGCRSLIFIHPWAVFFFQITAPDLGPESGPENGGRTLKLC